MAQKIPARQALMLGVIGVLGVAVFLSRAGVLSSGPDETGEADAKRQAYVSKASLLERQRSLVGGTERWGQVRDDAAQQWGTIGDMLLRADSKDLAEEDLLERVAAELRTFGVTLKNRQPDSPPSEADASLALVEVRIDFVSLDAEQAVAVVDRLENLDDLALHVRRAELKGPGIKTIPHEIEVRLWVQGIAHLRGGASNE